MPRRPHPQVGDRGVVRALQQVAGRRPQAEDPPDAGPDGPAVAEGQHPAAGVGSGDLLDRPPHAGRRPGGRLPGAPPGQVAAVHVVGGPVVGEQVLDLLRGEALPAAVGHLVEVGAHRRLQAPARPEGSSGEAGPLQVAAVDVVHGVVAGRQLRPLHLPPRAQRPVGGAVPDADGVGFALPVAGQAHHRRLLVGGGSLAQMAVVVEGAHPPGTSLADQHRHRRVAAVLHRPGPPPRAEAEEARHQGVDRPAVGDHQGALARGPAAVPGRPGRHPPGRRTRPRSRPRRRPSPPRRPGRAVRPRSGRRPPPGSDPPSGRCPSRARPGPAQGRGRRRRRSAGCAPGRTPPPGRRRCAASRSPTTAACSRPSALRPTLPWPCQTPAALAVVSPWRTSQTSLMDGT